MNPKVRSITNFLNANLHRQIRMAEITTLAGLSRSRVDNLFRAELSQSPMQYLQEQRLQKACQLLETTSMKITQISLAVGYQDHSHFFRNFKKQLGMTPSEYRARRLTEVLDAGEPARK
jgi:transcriptional regulator GlxA family with amidase domain